MNGSLRAQIIRLVKQGYARPVAPKKRPASAVLSGEINLVLNAQRIIVTVSAPRSVKTKPT